MKNKLGMEITSTKFKVLVDGEETILETMENEIVECVTENITYNDVYLKILTLENCKKLSSICDTRYMCDYTKDEILSMEDEEFLKLKMFSFCKIPEHIGYYISNTQHSSFRDERQAEEMMNQEILNDYLDWLYDHPYEYRLYMDSQDINFKIDKEYAWEEGIYKIQLDNDIYIGQTNKFVRRYQQHKVGVKGGVQTDAHKLIKLGATFEMLEIEKDAKQRLIKEAQYVNKYIEDGYNVLNSTKVLFNGSNDAIKQNRFAEPKMGIIFNKSDLDKITKLLSDNNIDFKEHKFRDKKSTINKIV